MPGFEQTARCRAPAEEVWKLLYDPARFPEWWAGVERVEGTGGGDTVHRYTGAWPGFAYPTRVSGDRDGSRVTVSCLLSDILHEWTLEPAAEGCLVRLRVEIPVDEADRLEAVRAELLASLPRLVRSAERAAER